MRTRDLLFAALRDNPADDTARLALADFLEEEGQLDRAELMRLFAQVRMAPDSPQVLHWEERMRALLAAGVLPCVVETVNAVGMRFALVPPGSFPMGSPVDEEGRYDDEEPLHRVTITRPFWMGVYPVTQEQYQQVMGVNPSAFQPGGDDEAAVLGVPTQTLPVDSITWEEATSFCERLTHLIREHVAGREYRLPSEAEWEYACRAGMQTPTPYHFGQMLLSTQARFNASGQEIPPAPSSPTAVGSYPPNALGLYDMHGNIWEWCYDWFDEDYYRYGSGNDPAGPPHGEDHVLRGGSWFSVARVCRCACRNPIASSNASGFRVLLVHPEL